MIKNLWIWGSLILLLTSTSSLRAWASIPPAESSQQVYIQRYVNHLNYYYPDLKLAVNPLGSDKDQVIHELESLEDQLHGDQKIAPGSLTQLTCDNPICGGGGSGCGRFCHSVDLDEVRPL